VSLKRHIDFSYKEVSIMKLTDKANKRLTIAGLSVVCVVLVIAIVSQFKTEKPKEALFQPSSTVSDAVSPSEVIPEPSAEPKTPEVTVPPINSAETSSKPADTGDSSGTEQSIQAEVTKPTKPPQEVKTDPSKTPDGEKVDAVKPVEHDKVTKPASSASSSEPKSGDKKDGKIYVPGFGWIEDNGGGGSGTIVGNPGDELTGNKVGSMD
jgi:type IV secretory pathway VirB10-like protein